MKVLLLDGMTNHNVGSTFIASIQRVISAFADTETLHVRGEDDQEAAERLLRADFDLVFSYNRVGLLNRDPATDAEPHLFAAIGRPMSAGSSTTPRTSTTT